MSAWLQEADIDWYYALHKQQAGPVNLKGLAALYERGADNGGISDDSLVWCERMSGWTRLKDFAELRSILQLLQLQVLSLPHPLAAKPPPSQPQPPVPPKPCEAYRSRTSPSTPVRLSIAAPVPHMASSSPSQAFFPEVPNIDHSNYLAIQRGSTSPETEKSLRPSRSMATKYSGIKGFLKGWLPQRKPPSELVCRGILKQDPRGAVRVPERSSRGGSCCAPCSSAPGRIFGNHLSALLSRSDTVGGIPSIVRILMDRLRSNACEGLRLEGVFRIPGDQSDMQEMRRQLNAGSNLREVVAACDNLHSVAGLLKMFFRELPEPLFPYDLYDAFVDYGSKLADMRGGSGQNHADVLLQLLPPGHLELLRELISFLAEVVRYTSESKMNIGNTAAVFAPNLLRPRQETLEHLKDTTHTVSLIAYFIAHADRVFNIVLRWPQGHVVSDSNDFYGGGVADSTADVQLLKQERAADVAGNSTAIPGSSWRQASFHSEESAATASCSERLSASSAGSGAPACHRGSVEPHREVHSSQEASSLGSRAGRQVWYYLNGQHTQEGPVDYSTLSWMFEQLKLDGSTYLFTVGMSSWTLASDLGLPRVARAPAPHAISEAGLENRPLINGHI